MNDYADQMLSFALLNIELSLSQDSSQTAVSKENLLHFMDVYVKHADIDVNACCGKVWCVPESREDT